MDCVDCVDCVDWWTRGCAERLAPPVSSIKVGARACGAPGDGLEGRDDGVLLLY